LVLEWHECPSDFCNTFGDDDREALPRKGFGVIEIYNRDAPYLIEEGQFQCEVASACKGSQKLSALTQLKVKLE
jgi:hypothetical protein